LNGFLEQISELKNAIFSCVYYLSPPFWIQLSNY